MNPTLVVLAAGIGNRYGGLKQMDGVGPSGETIVDYSIFDAVRSGFDKVIFVIRRSIESDFREVFLDKLANRVDVDYVFQEIEDIPAGLNVPLGRTKPWGTSHAVLASRSKVRAPFAAINADDFYGSEAFESMAGFLRGVRSHDPFYSLVGYDLESTLSEHGAVARGVCDVDGNGDLRSIVERTHIERLPDGIVYRDESGRHHRFHGRETVSMNLWGFTPTFFKFASEAFERFVRERADDLKAEIYIPLVVNDLIKTGRAQVKVLPCGQKWFGVTYKNDRPKVVAELKRLVNAGHYPSPLWK
jgi:NDP-sugar pyrophosphorylase family protein